METIQIMARRITQRCRRKVPGRSHREEPRCAMKGSAGSGWRWLPCRTTTAVNVVAILTSISTAPSQEIHAGW